ARRPRRRTPVTGCGAFSELVCRRNASVVDRWNRGVLPTPVWRRDSWPMKRRVSFLALLAACTTGSPPSVRLVPESQLAPGMRLGAHEVALNGARQFYRVAGPAVVSTPPVVFLHGGPGQGSAHFDGLAGPFMERDLRM